MVHSRQKWLENVQVATQLPQQLKSMLFEQKKFLHSSADPFGIFPSENISKNVEGKQCDSTKLHFFWILAYYEVCLPFIDLFINPELFVYHYRPKNFPMKINQQYGSQSNKFVLEWIYPELFFQLLFWNLDPFWKRFQITITMPILFLSKSQSYSKIHKKCPI